jgi:hypothetical protein
MSGERPKAPLWPEGISKVRPLENQRIKALTEGVSAPVAKQPEGTNPIFNHVNELQLQATLRREEAVPLQLNPAEQKERERLSKPPPAETPGIDQKEAVPDGQRENKKKYEYPVHPSKTDPDWKSYSKRERKKLDDEWFFKTIVDGIRYDYEARTQELEESGHVLWPPREKRLGTRFGS